jgi:hypothetical protein
MSQAGQSPTANALPGERQRTLSPSTVRSETTFHATILIFAVVVVGLSLALSTGGEEQVILPWFDVPTPDLCVSKRMLNLECPGCGMTRSFISIAHADLSAAWHFNPAGIILFGVIFSQIPIRAVQLLRLRSGRRPYSLHRLQWVLWIVVAVMITQWVVKLATRMLA